MSGLTGTLRRVSLAAVVGLLAVVFAAGLLVWPRSAPAGGSEPAPSGTPSLPSGVPDIQEARTALGAQHPETAGLLDALLREDVDTVLRAFPVSEGPCETFLVRGGTRCERQGLSQTLVVQPLAEG